MPKLRALAGQAKFVDVFLRALPKRRMTPAVAIHVRSAAFAQCLCAWARGWSGAPALAGPPAHRRHAHLYRVSSGSSSISRSSTPSVQNLILVTPWPHTGTVKGLGLRLLGPTQPHVARQAGD